MLLEFEDAKGSFAHDPLSFLLRVEGGVVKDYFRSLRDKALDWEVDFFGGSTVV